MDETILDEESNAAPRVDVICCVKNGGDQITDTIESVLTQTFLNFRFIIVNDGSTDEITAQILKTAEANDDRIIVYHNPISRGLTANLFMQVEQSDADFVARIDAGDTWLPEKLSKQIYVMQHDPSIIVLGTQCAYISRDGETLGASRFGEDDQAIRRDMNIGNGVLSHPSILFRRIINYRIEFYYSQDLDLYLRASTMGRLRCLKEPLTVCLIDPDGLTLRKKYLQRKYQSLAYRSHKSLMTTGGEINLYVSDGVIERKWWGLVMPVYHRYMSARIKKRSAIVWGAYLVAALILFPPLLGDYSKRLVRHMLNQNN
jgi:glycosyltransferase involved in cell wall biosynthesis